MSKHIGTRIREARKAVKLTQTDLANKINKQLRTVQKYESGEIAPSIEVINEISTVLNVSPNVLIGCGDNIGTWRIVKNDPPQIPGRYLCFWVGLDYPDGVMDVLNFNGSYFPWERVHPKGRVVVTHWMPLPGSPVKKIKKGKI